MRHRPRIRRCLAPSAHVTVACDVVSIIAHAARPSARGQPIARHVGRWGGMHPIASRSGEPSVSLRRERCFYRSIHLLTKDVSIAPVCFVCACHRVRRHARSVVARYEAIMLPADAQRLCTRNAAQALVDAVNRLTITQLPYRHPACEIWLLPGVQVRFRAANKTTVLTARRARTLLGAACTTRTLRFLRAVHSHLTTARYVLLAVLTSPAHAGNAGGHMAAVGISAATSVCHAPAG